jgi:hypothetical protein
MINKNEVIDYLTALSKDEFSTLLDEAIEAVEKKNGKFIPNTTRMNDVGLNYRPQELKKSLENEINS